MWVGGCGKQKEGNAWGIEWTHHTVGFPDSVFR